MHHICAKRDNCQFFVVGTILYVPYCIIRTLEADLPELSSQVEMRVVREGASVHESNEGGVKAKIIQC